MKTHTTPDSFAPTTGDMSKEDFRRFGHELIDWISDYFENIEDLPVLFADRARRPQGETSRFAA